MPNMRVVYNNAVKRTSTLTADFTTGSLVASNVATDLKSEIWRAPSATPATLTLTWAAPETISAVAMPFCSLTSAATVRVRGYSDTACTVQVFDTGAVIAAPSSQVGNSSYWGVTSAGANTYSQGGAASAVVYFAQASVQGLKIELSDTTNPLGYIEVGCLVVGKYWSPVYNVQNGDLQVDIVDSSKHERSESGDLFTDRGIIYKSLTLSLQHMPATDRNEIWRILRGNGMSRPVFISVIPESSDSTEEYIFSIYGKLSKGSSIQYQFIGQAQTSLQVEEL